MIGGLWRSFSGLGVLLGALFFAASLTPSLIPRTLALQGALGGVAFACGYGIGVLLLWIWEWLELPQATLRLRRIASWLAAAVAAGMIVGYLWRWVDWQNSVRVLVGMEPVEAGDPARVGLIAVLVALALIFLGRMFHRTGRLVSSPLQRVAPRRVSNIVGLLVAALVFALLINDVLLRGLLRVADASFAAADARFEPDIAAPTDPIKTGSAASLVSWQDLGRAGREYVATAPNAARISAITGRPAIDPLRVYVGLNAADDADARAELALAEMIRVGAFDRSVLIVTVPTGTGWMDPAGTDTLEYLHGGDVATVAVQYSYLTSFISILIEPRYGEETGRALFHVVYEHWTNLPRDRRPQLYLNGLSLGAISSEQSVELYEMLADPIQGALWVGPPFPSPSWRRFTDERNPGSPAWLPEVGSGSFVRFLNQNGAADDLAGRPWGPMRLVYLQYASDPVTFFEPAALWREPAWMKQPRGPDVSDELYWYPVVTFLQLLLDLAIGLQVPIGHGHLYAPEHYVDAWNAVTAPAGWSAAELDALKAHFAATLR
jgi:uncharacterized membrane protein